jgi:hypothetical protein
MSPESVPSDAEALQRVVAGHLPALGELYDRHAGLAYGLALRITGDASDAEEVVQAPLRYTGGNLCRPAIRLLS